nr:pentapeptide repeat-containing protein [uncultured Cohaesibacter sp.]
MNDKEIIKLLTPTGIWLRGHLIYLGTFVLLFSGLGLWLIFHDVANAEASVWKEFSEIARNLGLLLLGVIGLPLAIWRSTIAAKQVRIAENGQNIERFTNAAGLLSSTEQSGRIAGIVALRELARIEPRNYYFPVQNLLCAYVREQSMEYRDVISKIRDDITKKRSYNLPTTRRFDIDEAVSAFSSLRTPQNLAREKSEEWIPDLTGAYLVEFSCTTGLLNLEGAHLDKAIFTNTPTAYTNLSNADVFDTVFIGFHAPASNIQSTLLSGSIFVDAEIHGCYFRDSIFDRVIFIKTKFEGADCANVDFIRSIFDDCNVEKTKFIGSYFINCEFIETNFSSSDLTEAEFTLPILPREIWPENSEPSATKYTRHPFENWKVYSFIPTKQYKD